MILIAYYTLCICFMLYAFMLYTPLEFFLMNKGFKLQNMIRNRKTKNELMHIRHIKGKIILPAVSPVKIQFIRPDIFKIFFVQVLKL